jgi:phage shock protein A
MALPKAVQQQLEEADRIVADINGEKTGEDSSETNPVNQQVDQDIQADPPLNDLPPDNTVSQETKQPEVPEEKWAHKYHTLKGMYDAEVPRLHSQVREMQTQIQQLIADKAAVEATKVEQKQVVESLITEQDKEAFGPDLIDLIERATESKVGTLREREAQLGSVSERQVVSDKDRFLAGLGQQVSDWEALNVDQGFLAWLQQVDPVYGVPRQAALSNAYEVLDVTRVANIFKAYKQTLPQTPAPSKAKQELQRQVAPTRTRSTTTPSDNVNDKIFTNQDIEQFYNDWRRGFYDEQEAADMEKQIHTAIAEGRIR